MHNFFFRTSARSVPILLALIALLGCSETIDDGRPPRAKVTGKVTLDGTPVEGAVVRLTSSSNEEPGAVGKTNANGEFSVTTWMPGDGALPGTYPVTVSKRLSEESVSQAEAEKLMEQGRPIPPPKVTELVPKKYTNPRTSGLEITVELDKENVLNLDLES